MTLHSWRNFYFKILPKLLISLGVLFLVISAAPFILSEAWFFIKEAKSQVFFLEGTAANTTTDTSEALADSVFARFLSTRPIKMEPVDRDFGLVIERLGVNVPIVADVPVTDEAAYTEALKTGVAHAITSQYPSEEPGNVYLFAHASLNFFRLGRHATVFNLLRKLEAGDRVHVFYQGDTYVYEVVNNEVVRGWNTYPITRPVLEPILTLQTCDPPGTTINRMVVTAKLLEVQPSSSL